MGRTGPEACTIRNGRLTEAAYPHGRYARYAYDEFGQVKEVYACESPDPAGLDKDIGKKNPYRYSGYRYDPETKLYHLKTRYYDPRLGRFLSKDIWRGMDDNPLSLNRYIYGCNNPLNRTDPAGLQPGQGKLREDYYQPHAGLLIPSVVGLPGSYEELAQLDEPLRVMVYQSLLAALGYYKKGVDGIHGPGTTAGLAAFVRERMRGYRGSYGDGRAVDAAIYGGLLREVREVAWGRRLRVWLSHLEGEATQYRVYYIGPQAPLQQPVDELIIRGGDWDGGGWFGCGRGYPPADYVHRGIDLLGEKGKDVVYAVVSGNTTIRVEGIKTGQGGGLQVDITAVGRRDGLKVINQHLYTYCLVRDRQYVGAGEPIGLVGDTGNAKDTRPHLHLAFQKTAGTREYLDPKTVLSLLSYPEELVATAVSWPLAATETKPARIYISPRSSVDQPDVVVRAGYPWKVTWRGYEWARNEGWILFTPAQEAAFAKAQRQTGESRLGFYKWSLWQRWGYLLEGASW